MMLWVEVIGKSNEATAKNRKNSYYLPGSKSGGGSSGLGGFMG
jgi:hypothetical protein